MKNKEKMNEKTNDDWICYKCEHEWREENEFACWGSCPKCGSENVAHY